MSKIYSDKNSGLKGIVKNALSIITNSDKKRSNSESKNYNDMVDSFYSKIKNNS